MKQDYFERFLDVIGLVYWFAQREPAFVITAFIGSAVFLVGFWHIFKWFSTGGLFIGRAVLHVVSPAEKPQAENSKTTGNIHSTTTQAAPSAHKHDPENQATSSTPTTQDSLVVVRSPNTPQ